MHNLKSVVRYGLRDGIVVHLGAQITDYVGEELPVGREEQGKMSASLQLLLAQMDKQSKGGHCVRG